MQESASPTHAASSLDFELPVVDGNPAPGPEPGGGAGPSSGGTQGNWRFCTKCYSLFWYGYPTAGVCPDGGQHSPLESASPTHAATSWDFQLEIVSGDPAPGPGPGGGGGPSSGGTQGNWRFCTKCYTLFWYGYPTAGVCPDGGQHSPLESASPTRTRAQASTSSFHLSARHLHLRHHRLLPHLPHLPHLRPAVTTMAGEMTTTMMTTTMTAKRSLWCERRGLVERRWCQA